MPLQPAVLGANTRLNNFRLNYLTAAQAADRPTHIRIILDGIDITQPTAPTRVIYKSLTIRDALFDTPNTCAMTLYGAAPNVGQPLEVWFNSNDPVLLFGGELQTVARTYKGRPSTVLHPVTAIDDTARANRRRPLMPFVNMSASTIAGVLMNTYAPEFSHAGIEVNLPPVTINFDGSEAGMKGCLTALAKLIGASWFFENHTLYFFITPPGPAPDPIDDTPGRFLHDPAITWTIDKSQVRTRVFGKGASTRISAAIAAGTTLVPIENAEMFNPVGGRAIAAQTPDGAASRVVTYTSVQLGGGGGLVGTGAAPSAAPGLTALAGAGIESGVHAYAVTFTTAAGETIAGPAASVTVGTIAPPALPPAPGAATSGGLVDPGSHAYLVTFVTASGETTNSPGSAIVTTTKGAGVPVPGTSDGTQRKVAGGQLVATVPGYRYQTTITVAGGGESLPGSSRSYPGTTIQPPDRPWSVLGPGGTYTPVPGPAVPFNEPFYYLAFVVGGYESGVSQNPLVVTKASGAPTGTQFSSFETSPDARVTGRRLYRQYQSVLRLLATLDHHPATGYTDVTPDASLGPARTSASAPIGTPPPDAMTVLIPTSSDPRAVGRKIYRADGAVPFRYLATVNNNTATQYIDNTASVATNPDAPTTDTSGGASYQTVPLSGILTGPASVTARKLYRASNGAPYKLLTTIANNAATTYTDTTASASLGAGLPAGNTATANQVSVTVPIGGATVTGRTLYRSAAGQSLLKLLTTIANNTATAHTDAAADATLGASPPAVDTSGLAQPSGQVPAGSTSLIVANAAPFASGGGWVVIGNGDQVIRYTGKTATSLTGIPASGPGAIVATISFNSTVTAAPALVGVVGLLDAVIRNAPIHVWVQRDDLAAQTYMVALDGGGDGVYEHIWSDERRSEASLNQVCDAQLALYSRPLVTVTYATRDQKTKSGKTVTINLATPSIAESLTIQDVQITDVGITNLAPKFTVTASTARQSFEAILQMLIRKADA